MAVICTDDGCNISYQETGSGPLNVTFLHGWGGSARYWDEVIHHLYPNRIRAIAISFRGHGDSDKTTSGFTLDRFAKDVILVADDGGADQFAIIGFSMSGKYAQYVTLMRPERVSGQVLIAPVGAGEFPLPADIETSFCGAAGNRSEIRKLLAPISKIPIAAELEDRFLEDFVKIPKDVLVATFDMFSRNSFVDRVKAIRTPTLVIGGEYDPFMPPEYLNSEVVGCLSRAGLITLPCGHEIPHEMPRETAWLVTAFLAFRRLEVPA